MGGQGYTAAFYYGKNAGTGVGMGIDDFVTDRREVRHEMAHAINHTLFPTKNDIEPWYNTFDEGSAMYASGEVENGKSAGMDFKKDDGTLENYVGSNAYLDYLISNPNKFWERLVFSGNPGHMTGFLLYALLEHEGLTPEKMLLL